MNPFRYERTSDASTAIAMLAQVPAGVFLGGGTNLVVRDANVSVDNERLREKIARLEDGRPLALGKWKP